ncbi:MAG: hypothetical protein II951_02010 [Bacteroidales bacterium]|nr:hypothetical protein [Bacteroidales bacterium]
MVKRFLSICLAAIACSSFASATDLTLVRLDGTGLVKDLSLVGRFEILNGGTSYRLVARADGEEIVSGSIASLSRISFVPEDLVPDTPTALDAFTIDGSSVNARTNDVKVRIYGLGGALFRTSDNGSVSADGLPAGLYIVVSGGKAAKMIVK